MYKCVHTTVCSTECNDCIFIRVNTFDKSEEWKNVLVAVSKSDGVPVSEPAVLWGWGGPDQGRPESPGLSLWTDGASSHHSPVSPGPSQRKTHSRIIMFIPMTIWLYRDK